MRKIKAVYFLFFLLCLLYPAYGYGEKVDTLLLWQERAVAVLTNACRMAPLTFRDRYIGNSTILTPEKYPADPPLYWNRELNVAARFHCVEMGLECGMVHECNGVSFSDRLKRFYTKSSYIAENIAAGYQMPHQVVNAWLIDGRSAAEAAADGSGNDGHRANIMSPRLREIGCGYFVAGTGRTAKTYWCQDFGGGKSGYAYHPVCDASHLFFTAGQITFFVNLYDTAEAVSELWLVLDGTRRRLELDMGKPTAGTYSVTLASAAACRSYAVEVLFKNGRTMYYPEEGVLLTIGEGSCTEGAIAHMSRAAQDNSRKAAPVSVCQSAGNLVLALASEGGEPTYTDLFDGKGVLRFRAFWNRRKATVPLAVAPPGLSILRHFYPDGSVASARLINCR